MRFLDYTEVYKPDGSMRVGLRGLPRGLTYTITVPAAGRVESRSRNGSDPSIRYYVFGTYQEALDHGIAWGRRKIRGMP